MNMNEDKYNLVRFEQAQHECYDRVVRELAGGRKQTHWMWYIFPQLSHLGQSETSQFYGISCLGEAKAFLNHPILGARLQECIRLVNQHPEQKISHIFGWPDELKFHSCLTLFEQVANEESGSVSVDIAKDIQCSLNCFFDGAADQETLRILQKR